jgi:elongation factor G
MAHGTAGFSRRYARHEPMPQQVADRVREEERVAS